MINDQYLFGSIEDNIIRAIGDNGGRMCMRLVFYKLGKPSEDVDGKAIAYNLSRNCGYIIPYGEKHPELGIVEKGNWILSEKGWEHYRALKENDNLDIPY